jgi:hypothetical protein
MPFARRNATIGLVSSRAAAPIGRMRTAGRSIQSGIPASSSGGISRIRMRCCTMCALNRK